MRCNQQIDTDCDNETMCRCRTCIAPMWCLCQRIEVRTMISKIWDEASNQG